MYSFALEKDAVLVGTSRRMKSFPFTFDQQPGSARRLVQEKGSMAQHWRFPGDRCGHGPRTFQGIDSGGNIQMSTAARHDERGAG